MEIEESLLHAHPVFHTRIYRTSSYVWKLINEFDCKYYFSIQGTAISIAVYGFLWIEADRNQIVPQLVEEVTIPSIE